MGIIPLFRHILSHFCCTGQDANTLLSLSEMAFNISWLIGEWKKLKYKKQWGAICDLGWDGSVEAVRAGQSCNLPAGIWLHCGGSSVLPCHLLVCVWLDVSMDVCVHHPLWRTTKLTSQLPGHTPVLTLYSLCVCVLYRCLFIFCFITFKMVAAQSISNPSNHSTIFSQWHLFFLTLLLWLSHYNFNARHDFHLS